MSPVSELAQRLRRSGAQLAARRRWRRISPTTRWASWPKALDDYAARLTEVVQRDREFNADVSHELRTPLAVIRGAVELLLARPELDEQARARGCSASSAPSSSAPT